jgi:hypothetical protein
MKTLHVVLGNTDRAANNRIEAILHDVCFERAVIEFARAARTDELVRLACCQWMNLVVFAPDNLLPAPGQRMAAGPVAEALRTTRVIRSETLVPMIAVGVSEDDKLELLEAGVNLALGIPFPAEAFRREAEALLNLPPTETAATEQVTPAGAGWFGRFAGFLKS